MTIKTNGGALATTEVYMGCVDNFSSALMKSLPLNITIFTGSTCASISTITHTTAYGYDTLTSNKIWRT
jgi:hypothetical protein